MAQDPYALLGISPSASLEEITAAYRALAQIYHPDRYADASGRVLEEAEKRMRALNNAYEEVRQAARDRAGARAHTEPRRDPASPPPPEWRDPPSPPPRPTPARTVHYVDGTGRFHHGDMAPVGFRRDGSKVTPDPSAPRCARLDRDLLDWFKAQQANASLAQRQRYDAWDLEEQARYAARTGCTQIPRDDARTFGVPCAECKP